MPTQPPTDKWANHRRVKNCMRLSAYILCCVVFLNISIGGYRRLGSSAKCALLLLEYRNETKDIPYF